MLEVCPSKRRTIEAIYTVVERADPERSCSILENRLDEIAAQAVGIFLLTPVEGKLLRIRVKLIDASAIGSDPEQTRSVLAERGDESRANARWILAIGEKSLYRSSRAVKIG